MEGPRVPSGDSGQLPGPGLLWACVRLGTGGRRTGWETGGLRHCDWCDHLDGARGHCESNSLCYRGVSIISPNKNSGTKPSFNYHVLKTNGR